MNFECAFKICIKQKIKYFIQVFSQVIFMWFYQSKNKFISDKPVIHLKCDYGAFLILTQWFLEKKNHTFDRFDDGLIEIIIDLS